MSVSPGVILRDMAIAFLECPTFLEEFWELGGKCCPRCHEDRKNKMHVRPFREGVYGQVGNTDWELCVEAIICCGIYDLVRALPREWWVKKARELGVYSSRGDDRGYIYPDSPTLSTPPHHVTGGRSRREEREENETDGLAAWMKNR